MLGYVPEELVYNDKQLHTRLSNNGFDKKSKREELIKNAKFQLKTEYVFAVCKEILQYQEDGVLLRVGSDKSVDPQLMFPYIVMITADNMESDYLAGTRNSTSSQSSSRRCCRLCMDTNSTAIHLMGTECHNYRRSYLHSSLSYAMHLVSINTDLEYRISRANREYKTKLYDWANKKLSSITKSVSVRKGTIYIYIYFFFFLVFLF